MHRYDAVMKSLRAVTPLLTSLLLVSGGWSQDSLTPKDVSSGDGDDRIAAARRAYARNEGRSYDANGVANLNLADDSPATAGPATVAQLPRHGSRMPIPPRRGYNGGAYPPPWMGHGGPGHVLIGAAIGFSIGATAGGLGSAHNGTSVGGGAIIGATIFGFIGAAIGAACDGSHLFMHHRRFDRRPWPGDEDYEESSLPPHPKTAEDLPKLSVSSSPVPPSHPADLAAAVSPSPGMLAVP
jgi:hypothetical protein